MSCTLMYQPYAMSYSSSCDRPSASDRQKLFKFPHVPSPPDSSHSSASSYSGHSASTPSSSIHLPLVPTPTPSSSLSLSLSTPSPLSLHSHHAPHHHPHHHFSAGNRPHHPSFPSAITPTSISHSRRPLLSPSGPSATITSASAARSPPSSASSSATGPNSDRSNNSDYLHHSHHQHRASSTAPNPSASTPGSSSTQTSHSMNSHNTQQQHSSHHNSSHRNETEPSAHGSSSSGQTGSTGGGNNSTQPGGSNRAQYLSANCVVYENYDGDSTRVVDEHFSRALSATYASPEKSSKNSLPMSTRNFPPSFWNSAYQPPPKHFASSYGATGSAGDFYGSAMDYGTALAAHHHQSDPWHYPLTSHHHHHHQSYHHHHRAAELAYPPMPSTSRFTPAQYGSFLFPGAAAAAASTAAGRFAAIPGPSQCGVKGETGHWGAGGRYHPHEPTWPDFHLADYSAAAAHYSNMTAAGLDFESHYLQSS